MSANSKIEWTDHTFNPWWGCVKVSPGCKNCYAEGVAGRWGHDVWGANADRRFFSDKHWNEPLKWNRVAERAGVPARVFCGSMCDVFEDRSDLIGPRARLIDLIDATPWLDWLLLTKRPENAKRLARYSGVWPSNVWLGTSVEDQERADQRIPHLLDTPAAVRFLSCEPLLGPVNAVRRFLPGHEIRRSVWGSDGCLDRPSPPSPTDGLVWAWRRGVDWVIVGGESGPGARPMDLQWARHIVQECQSAGVPAFVKQLGERPVVGVDIPVEVTGKGGDPAEWPEDLRVRDLPRTSASAMPPRSDAGAR